MLKFVTSSIRNQITAVILVAVVSAVLISSIGAAWRQAVRQFDAKQTEIHGIAAAMATTIAEPVKAGQRRQIAATLNAISRIPGFTYASARGRDGRLLYQHGAGIVVRRDVTGPVNGESFGPLTSIYLNTHISESPIVYAGEHIGTLTLIADLSSLRHALLDSLLTSLALGAMAGAFGIGAALFLQRTITNPIITLTRTMQEVCDSGDFGRIAERQSANETGLMVDTFNEMLAQIRTRDAALLHHREELEATVDERTRDLRQAKFAAEQANAAKSDFLATMSHEIRTPMNGMLVMAELISVGNLSPRLQRYADVIVKSGNGLLAIINDILDFSKIEAGRLELESIPVNPRKLVDETLQLFSERAVSANLEIAGYVAPGVPQQIISDPVRLGQVLTNFVNNALKFTSSGGVKMSIELADGATRRDGQVQLRFSVHDTGIGIPDDKIATIFEAFSQADQSTTREFGGTGIGLSICKRLIEAMDGELSVQSTVGEGSTFSFVTSFQSLGTGLAIPSAPRLRTAAVDLPPGFTRDVLIATLQDWQIAAVLDDDAGATAATADIRFCDLGAILHSIDPAAVLTGLSGAPIVAVGRFGDTRGDRLIDEGRVARVIDRPLAVMELATLLETAIEDPKNLLAPRKSTKSRQQVTSFAGVRVLAADDSPVNREVLSEVLKRLDVQTTSVEDGEAAVEAMKTGGFDLVFMDGSMPRLDGFEATRQIRAWEIARCTAPVPIVALTAHVVGNKGQEWRDAGMNDFVSKPFTLAAIEACLKQWLTGTRAHTTHDRPVGTNLARVDVIAPPLVDYDVLSMIREIQTPDDNLVARVIRLYMEHAPTELARLAAYEASARMTDIAATAHALKSLCRNVGAVRVGDMADEIESNALKQQRPTGAERRAIAIALNETLEALRILDDLRDAA